MNEFLTWNASSYHNVAAGTIIEDLLVGWMMFLAICLLVTLFAMLMDMLEMRVLDKDWIRYKADLIDEEERCAQNFPPRQDPDDFEVC